MKTFILEDDKMIVAKMIRLATDRMENIVEIGEIAGDQHFFLFPRCIEKVYYPSANNPMFKPFPNDNFFFL